jgi:hypothetical protein
MSERLQAWLLAALLALAAVLPFSEAPAASEPRPNLVHGISELPGGAPVPERDRPPGAREGDGGPSSVVFPKQRLTIRFNHALHVTKLKAPCTACHDRARTSRQSSDRLLPAASRCDGCHGSDHRDLNRVRADPGELLADCGFCHLGYRPEHGNRVERLTMPVPNLKFDHAGHLARGMACASCHGGVEHLELATRDAMPRMRACVSCHRLTGDGGSASGACTTCHPADGRRLKTHFGKDQLLPPAWLNDSQHGPDWIVRHRQVAGEDSGYCGTCHTEKDCADCHDGRVRPRRAHPNDFLSMHPVSARQDSPRCASCHQTQNFCLPCHQRIGVTASGPVGNFAERGRFHPPPSVWTDAPRSTRHHAWEAERNLNACISCHVERDCVACHATRDVGGAAGGLPAGAGRGLNPHPSGFRARCARALRQNARPCLVCHAPADPLLGECR